MLKLFLMSLSWASQTMVAQQCLSYGHLSTVASLYIYQMFGF